MGAAGPAAARISPTVALASPELISPNMSTAPTVIFATCETA